MTKEIGTLEELNVNPGDVVEYVHKGSHHTVLDGKRLTIGNGDPINYEASWDYAKDFRVVSRAHDKPKLWIDMTPEEKGALLLAMHEGKKVGVYSNGKWLVKSFMTFVDDYAYRIEPEPKVETVKLRTAKVYDWYSVIEDACGSRTTHRITFDLIDGEPDCTSIKMEKLSG